MEFEIPNDLPEELEEFNKRFPDLKDGQVWAGTLKISVVNFPSPAHTKAFFAAITKLVEKLCDVLKMVCVESTVGIGMASKIEGHDGDSTNPIAGLDLSKFKN